MHFKILLLLFLSIYFRGFSQDPYYFHINKKNGLPSNSVYDIFQDRTGFIWFATDKGLVQYDGSKFSAFTAETQTSISGSSITEDKFGRIWYCNFDGYLYYIENKQLKALNQPETIGYFKYGIDENFLYLIQKNKVIIYDLKTLKIKKAIPIQGEKIIYTFFDDGKFFVLSDCLYEISSGKINTKYNLPKTKNNIYQTAIIQKTTKGLMIVSKNNRSYFILSDGKFSEKQFPEEIPYIQNLFYIDYQNWICSTKGIYAYNFKDKIKKTSNYFADYNISSIYKDNQNNYWISTLDQGVLLVENFKSKLLPMSSRPFSIIPKNDHFIVSADHDKIFEISKKDYSVTPIYSGKSNHPIRQILVDGENTFFTASTFKILNSKNQIVSDFVLSVKEIKRISHKYYAFSASGINGIFTTDKSTKSQWKYTKNSQIPPNSKLFYKPLLPSVNGKSVAYNSQNKNIYFATNNGLFTVKSNKSKELFYQNKKLFVAKIINYQNTCYILSTNGKLFLISEKNIISKIPIPANLHNDFFEKIKIIGNELYIFGEKNIYTYSLTSKRFSKIFPNTNDLEISDVVVQNSQHIFATSKGLLFSEKQKTTISAPKIIISDILVNNKKLNNNYIQNLNHTENNLNIQFSVLSYLPNQNLAIEFRINNKEWQKLDSESRSLYLNSLSPGDYKIDFRTKTDDYFSKIKTVKFCISKPFWLQLWFILPVISLFLFLIYLLFKYRVRKIRQQNQLLLEKIQLEQNMNQSKLKAIKSQMNPHFFYNALNTIQAYILSNEKKLAVNYLSKFSLLTRTILEMTEKDDVNISEEIKTITLYLEMENARFDDKLQYNIQCDEILEFENPKIPSMMLQPYIENAIKHGLLHRKGEKKLLISFGKIDNNIVIKIDDNGIGRKKSNELKLIKNKKHLSFATEAMQKRIEILNSNKENKIFLQYIDKENNVRQSTGTTVIITVPID
ncbi:histidine kinase [Cloacibacterium sp.]|uniref:sensor histidine kinase n=1 Tax=Cloacibacterium sp. TaxID=1913682 RepID=UPI0039E4F8BA